MNLSRIAAAGLVIASLGLSATADAQGPRGPGPGGPGPHGPGPGPRPDDHRWGDHRGPGDHGPGRPDRYDHRGPDFRGDRHHDRYGYRGDHRDYGYNGYGRGHCRVTYRHHRPVRVCR